MSTRQIDQAWKDAQARNEALNRAQSSHKLISAFELAQMWLKLRPGQVLVLSADGSIHEGNRHDAKLDKMQRLKEEFKTERHIDMRVINGDIKAGQEMYPMPITGNSRSKNWDTRPRLADGTRVRKSKAGKPAEPVMPADDI